MRGQADPCFSNRTLDAAMSKVYGHQGYTGSCPVGGDSLTTVGKSDEPCFGSSGCMLRVFGGISAVKHGSSSEKEYKWGTDN
jgi:hypothetical protein